jgi:hypothetical protein
VPGVLQAKNTSLKSKLTEDFIIQSTHHKPHRHASWATETVPATEKKLKAMKLPPISP